MSPTSPTGPTTTALCLEGELTIYRAAELRATLQAALAGLPAGSELELDLAAVTAIDSAGVQLLISAGKTARAGQCELRLAGHSVAVTEVFAALDLAALFGAPLPAPCA
jgi:anti-anti-sigma factor